MSTDLQRSQPSKGLSLPSSHSSGGWRTPSPQRGQSESAASTAPSQSLSVASVQETSRSSGGVTVGRWVQPKVGSQASSVQTLESSQLTATVSQEPPAAALQKPARHLSSTAQLSATLRHAPK